MPRVIKARYVGGVLKPLDKVDLNEGEVVSIVIEEKTSTGIADLVRELRRTTPKVENPVEILEELRR